MIKLDAKTTLNDIHSLLDEEHQILTTGDHERMEGLADKKLKMIEKLSEGDATFDAQDLAKVRARTEYHSRLYESVMEGYQNVAKRLKDIRDAQNSLKTYTESGKLDENLVEPSQLETRS